MTTLIFILLILHKKNMDYEINISVKNLNETKYLAKVFSLTLKSPLFISLKGKIGSGKTTFASLFINQLSKKKN